MECSMWPDASDVGAGHGWAGWGKVMASILIW